jgi:hypothetical protein
MLFTMGNASQLMNLTRSISEPLPTIHENSALNNNKSDIQTIYLPSFPKTQFDYKIVFKDSNKPGKIMGNFKGKSFIIDHNHHLILENCNIDVDDLTIRTKQLTIEENSNLKWKKNTASIYASNIGIYGSVHAPQGHLNIMGPVEDVINNGSITVSNLQFRTNHPNLKIDNFGLINAPCIEINKLDNLNDSIQGIFTNEGTLKTKKIDSHVNMITVNKGSIIRNDLNPDVIINCNDFFHSAPAKLTMDTFYFIGNNCVLEGDGFYLKSIEAHLYGSFNARFFNVIKEINNPIAFNLYLPRFCNSILIQKENLQSEIKKEISYESFDSYLIYDIHNQISNSDPKIFVSNQYSSDTILHHSQSFQLHTLIDDTHEKRKYLENNNPNDDIKTSYIMIPAKSFERAQSIN